MADQQTRPKVILTRGLPASGKSTWAKEQVTASGGATKHVNKDDIRAMLDCGEWSPGNEKLVEHVRDNIITAAVARGHDIIVDDTNLVPRHERRIRNLVGKKADVVVKDFTHVPADECVRRDALRDNPVGEEVIRKWENTLTENRHLLAGPDGDVEGQRSPKAEADPDRPRKGKFRGNTLAKPHDPALPTVVVCDLDGTLALMTSGRSPYQFDRCGEDTLNPAVAHVLATCGLPVILMSGRDGSCRPQTEEWLTRHGIAYDQLLMRAAGDKRPDDIVKRELHDQHVAGKFNVQFVLDDRDRVVKVWRELGYATFQVNEGNF